MRLLERVENCGCSRLIFRQSAFTSPLPHPRSKCEARLPLSGSAGTGPLWGGRRVLSGFGAARGSGGCGPSSVTWPPLGGGKCGPRGAVPLNPAPRPLFLPADALTTRPELPGGGGGRGRGPRLPHPGWDLALRGAVGRAQEVICF